MKRVLTFALVPLSAALLLSACGPQSTVQNSETVSTEMEQTAVDTNTAMKDIPMATNLPKSVEKLTIEEIASGSGEPVKAGDVITVNYTGYFLDGKVFDTSKGRQPFELTIGAGQVIEGWDQGLLGMQKGGQRRLLIPYTLAYGENGYPGAIPPKSDLVFDVELVDVQAK